MTNGLEHCGSSTVPNQMLLGQIHFLERLQISGNLADLHLARTTRLSTHLEVCEIHVIKPRVLIESRL